MGNIGPNAINYALYKTLPYKAADFAPVTLVISVPNVLVVNEASPARSVADLRARSAAGSVQGVFRQLRRGPVAASVGRTLQATRGHRRHAHPLLSGRRARDGGALLGGQFTFMIDNPAQFDAYIQSGRSCALAVITT